MQETVIDGIAVYIKSGRKYRKFPSGQWVVVCKQEGCNKQIQSGCGAYCTGHYNALSEDELADIEKAKKDNAKEKQELQDKMKKGKTTIDGIEIYIIESKKYRLGVKGRLRHACSYDQCNKFAHHRQSYIYCNMHRNGTTPDDEERQKELIALTAKMSEHGKNSAKTGDATEAWVIEQLRLIKSIVEIEPTGHTGSKYDIKFKLKNDNDSRGIQVKTISRSALSDKSDSYRVGILNMNYSDNTLFVFVNTKRDRFALMYYNDIIRSSCTFNFNNNDSTYAKHMYKDHDKFMKRLAVMVKSTDICSDDSCGKYREREADGLERLKSACKTHGISFQRVEEGASKIDCIINDHKIQNKITSCLAANCYDFNIRCGNGVKKHRPYSNKDGIDFFIFEIIGFENNFYIIPIKVLITNGYIQTNKNKGSTHFLIPNPESNDKSHWTYNYLNNFELLK
jgi:hypothetical protein